MRERTEQRGVNEERRQVIKSVAASGAAVGALWTTGCLGDGGARERVSELEEEVATLEEQVAEREERMEELEDELEETEEELEERRRAESTVEPWDSVRAFRGADDPTMVAADADANGTDEMVEVVYYGDFGCPNCVRFERDAFSTLKDEYIATGDVIFVFRPVDFLRDANPNSRTGALGALAVWENDPDAYWTWHRTMFASYESQGDWAAPSKIGKMASGAGADGVAVALSVEREGHLDAVQRHRSQAKEADVRGTPSFIIDGSLVLGGDYDQLAGEIESAL